MEAGLARARVDEVLDSTRVGAGGARQAAGQRLNEFGSKLDLKFILHHGGYIARSNAGDTELLGPDVNSAHRVLKNDVVATTGWKAYALLSSGAVEHLDVSDEGGLWLQLEYEHIEPMETLVLPLLDAS